MTRQEKTNQIIEAARNQSLTEAIDNIELLSYVGDDGKVNEDRFDYIDTSTLPCTVHFIGGTGYENFSVPISKLTDESLDSLCECIIK